MEGTIVALSKEDLERLNERSAQIATETVMARIKEEQKKERQRRQKRRLHNTKILLRNYHMFKLSVENAVYTVQQMKEDMTANEILNDMMDRDDGVSIESIKQSKARTAVMVRHIDSMLEIYKAVCERSPNELDLRRYNILKAHYIDENKLSVKEIVLQFSVSKETVYKDLAIAEERLGALIFGVSGVL